MLRRLMILGLLALGVSVGVAGAAPLGSVSEYSSGLNAGNNLVGTVEAPDGKIYFSDKGTTPSMGVIDPSTGAITEYSIAANGGNAGSVPQPQMTVGPDGNIWFADEGTTKAIGEFDPTTHAVSEFSAGLNAGSLPYGVALGPDGNLWFTDRGSTRAIGMINPTTHVISEFSSGLDPASLPGADIAVGPDGNLWFTDQSATTPAIGTINPTTHAIKEYTSGLNPGGVLIGIALGPDGNLWFADNGLTKAIGKITPTGKITEFSSIVPTVSTVSGNTATMSEAATATGTSTLQFSATIPAVITSGSTMITLSSLTPAVSAGMTVAGGVGALPAGETVTNVSGNTVTLSEPAIGSQSGATVEFIATVAGVSTTAGSTSLTVPSGGFPAVSDGLSVSGTGIATGLLNPGSNPIHVAAGPDGNMWINDTGTSVTPVTPALIRVDPTTDAVTEFTEPPGMNTGAKPFDVTIGPDGNVWFPDTGATKAIGKFGLGVPAASVTAPAVTGTDGVGVAQSCGGDVWSTWAGQPPSHSAFGWDGYKWLLDGSPIAGATGATYTPTAAEAGHLLSCEATVTYTLLFVTASATSTAVEVKGAAQQLAELAAAVVGVGPGQSPTGKVAAIQGYVAASDTADACNALGAFGNEVGAQTGKTLSATQAASFGTQALDIEAALGC
jgi:streptogramin lyase